MILSLILLVVIGVIAYFHYMEGFFSASLSAIMASIAAIVALAYHEVLVSALLRGRFADQAYSLSLVILFAVTYLILRLIFDKAIPGNVRFPVILDKVGAGVMGFLAGSLGVGVLAIAIQALPFGPSIGQLARWDVAFEKDVQVGIPDTDRIQDAKFDELKDPDKFVKNEDPHGLWVPADGIVLGLVSRVSDTEGSLSAGRPFAATHPDYLQELFGQRVGIQSGSRHTATEKKLSVDGAYTAASFPQADQERLVNGDKNIGVRGKKSDYDNPAKKLPPVRKPEPGKILLVLRTTFDRDDTDAKTNLFTFTPASVRLVANRTNYFPIGTLEGGRILWVNQPDDILFTTQAADLVFEVDDKDENALLTKDTPRKFKDGVFLEVKRMARVYPAEIGIEVKPRVDPAPEVVAVVRKTGVPVSQGMSGTRGGDGTTTEAKDVTLTFAGSPVISSKLPNPVGVGPTSNDGDGTTEWGVFTLTNKKFSRLDVDPVQSLQIMAALPNPISEFLAPDAYVMVQATGRPSADIQDKWAFAANLADYALVDASNAKYPAIGAIAKIINANGQNMMVVRYNMAKPTKEFPPAAENRPTDVTLLFLVPTGTDIKSLEFKDGVVKAMQLKAP